MKKIKRVISVFALSFIFASSLYAGIAVAPTVVEKSLDGGQTAEGVYYVQNKETVPVKVTVTIENWLVRVYQEEGEEVSKVPDWITIEPNEFTLEPDSVKEIKYRIKAPASLKEEKVAQVFFEYSPLEGEALFKTRLGVIVYMSPKQGKLKAKIETLRVDYDEVRDGDQSQYFLTAVYSIQNNGEIHLRPVGDVTIWNSRSNEMVGHVSFGPTKGVYPDLKESFQAREEIQGPLSPGRYFAEARIDIGQLYKKDKILKERYHFKVE